MGGGGGRKVNYLIIVPVTIDDLHEVLRAGYKVTDQ